MPTAARDATLTEVVVSYTWFSTSYYREDGKATDKMRMVKVALYWHGTPLPHVTANGPKRYFDLAASISG